jgi:hypothetical protein
MVFRRPKPAPERLHRVVERLLRLDEALARLTPEQRQSQVTARTARAALWRYADALWDAAKAADLASVNKARGSTTRSPRRGTWAPVCTVPLRRPRATPVRRMR